METLQKRWQSLMAIEAIQSAHNRGNIIEEEANKLVSSSTS